MKQRSLLILHNRKMQIGAVVVVCVDILLKRLCYCGWIIHFLSFSVKNIKIFMQFNVILAVKFIDFYTNICDTMSINP